MEGLMGEKTGSGFPLYDRVRRWGGGLWSGSEEEQSFRGHIAHEGEADCEERD
jgi:hypothetical protein